jgi:hypothetical protein
MVKKSTHLFEGKVHGIEPKKEIKSSFSVKEEIVFRRDWIVRSSYAYNHKNTL